ncbi:PTS lactose/cellobiose transporter subunit IIA [Pseudoleptotrichia goodfellowii]|uniref:PTS system, Lactose/Cellobiose specific IIA subunit n=2 Tax=Pseudoleptotrichia goodfellowii TaxID=157692 RepID=D0GMN6_9FUSO|nr:PTS lactose/cellobiose transporter subunit IIA [Pseudoleptotrichia goodfellowii]EEY34648.1 PTS system, Lactose/Cellobiose specific IIA subunit [Pseudoleptotrichia goodfellowii F0264]BBM36932.1 PTS system lactose/ cellobiose-specific transporter subunit IIA [Pseudoleptotrichia goodfellowii]
MDKEKLELIVFDIVNSAGTAKGLAYEALGEAEKGNYEEAEKLLKEADKSLLAAHNIQTEIIQAETSGDNMEVSVLFVHAQDHLMTAVEAKSLIECMIKMYRRIENLEKK